MRLRTLLLTLTLLLGFIAAPDARALTTYDLSRAEAKAAAYNYTVVQRAAHAGAPSNALGWTDHSTRTNYVYTDRIDNLPLASQQPAARKVGMHEVGHDRWKARDAAIDDMHDWWRYIRRSAFTGYTLQSIEEDYAETYSWCKDVQAGVSYTWLSPRPTTTDLQRLCVEL